MATEPFCMGALLPGAERPSRAVGGKGGGTGDARAVGRGDWGWTGTEADSDAGELSL